MILCWLCYFAITVSGFCTTYNFARKFIIYLLDVCDPDWSYFNGFCYYTSETCTNWTTALNKCRQANSVLVDINNNEENVFLQHRHNGENPGWDWMTSPQRVASLGRIVELGTLQLGPKINQTILEKKTACTLLVWNTTTNGMTSSAMTVISILARKVSVNHVPGLKAKYNITKQWLDSVKV